MLLLLRVLEPQFIRCDVGKAHVDHGRRDEDGEIIWGGFPVDVLNQVDTLAEADGIRFLCPGCFQKNAGPYGTHSVHVYFAGKGAPPHIGLNTQGQTVRWEVRGNDYLDLTLAPSIALGSDCRWHGFIEHGVVRPA